jgi:Tfp pilus assembly protein PilN
MADQNEYQLMEINLLPSEYRQSKVNLSWLLDARVIWATFAFVLVAFVLSLLYYNVVETISELKSAVEQTKRDVDKERPTLDKINELERTKSEIKEKSEALHSIQVNRKRWVLMFEDFSTALKDIPGTWISGIIQEAEEMNISCTTWNFPEVASYMLSLEQKQSVTGVSLTNISAVKINGEDAYSFSLKVKFNPNLGLETGAY